VKNWLRWGGSLVLLIVLATRLNWAQVGASFASLRVELWLLAVLLYAVCQVMSSVRWRLLSGVVGFRGRVHRFVGMYFVGSFFNLLLPTSVGGDVVRIYHLSRMPFEGRAGRRTLATLSVFVDRVSGLTVLVAIACLAAWLSPLHLPTWSSVAVALAGVGVFAGLVGIAMGSYLARWVLPRLPNSWQPPLARLLTAAKLYMRHPKVLIGATLLSCAVQGLNVVVVWCIGLGLGINVPLVCYGVLVPLTTLLTLLPISLNGMGLREAGYALLMRPLGVAAPVAVTLSFLSFLAMVVVSLFGLVYMSGRSTRIPSDANEEKEHERSLGGDSDQGRTGQSSAAA